MKKITAFAAAVLLTGSLSTNVFAAEVTTQTAQTAPTEPTTQTTEAAVSYKEDAGVTPDSLLYTIDKAVDELRIVLAGSEEDKAAVNADIAQERLGESEVMAEEGKIELALKALEEYNQKITEAAIKLQEVVVNLEAAAGESSDEAVEESTTVEENTDEDNKLEQSIADLEKAIQDVQEGSLVVLDSLKDVVSEDSVEDVEEVIEEQTTHKEAVANFVKERHEFNAAKKALNMARVSLKKIQKRGSEEDIKAAQERLTAAQEEYMTAQAELHAAFQAKKAADLGIDENDEEVGIEEVGMEESGIEEAVQAAVEEAAATDAEAKPAEYIKTNNGNGNGNKPSKIEKVKKDNGKSAPGKSGEAHGKSGKANSKKK